MPAPASQAPTLQVTASQTTQARSSPSAERKLTSPVLDLQGLTLEVNRLERARVFYGSLLGLETRHFNPERGVLQMSFPNAQRLDFWMPVTRQKNDSRLASLGARGGSHVHFALQIPVGTRETAKRTLDAHGIVWQEIDLGDDSFHDYGLYFFDPFGHGLELREVVTNSNDFRFPKVAPGQPRADALPVIGLREVALAFNDFEGMLERFSNVYGFAFYKRQDERNFAQFTLASQPEPDGKHTPRRWLYAWDPQVGLADMFGGEHALVRFYADVNAIEARVREVGLPHLRDSDGLVVRDPEGHIFEFVERPA